MLIIPLVPEIVYNIDASVVYVHFRMPSVEGSSFLCVVLIFVKTVVQNHEIVQFDSPRLSRMASSKLLHAIHYQTRIFCLFPVNLNTSVDSAIVHIA